VAATSADAAANADESAAAVEDAGTSVFETDDGDDDDDDDCGAELLEMAAEAARRVTSL
jgi:hypothetical protein